MIGAIFLMWCDVLMETNRAEEILKSRWRILSDYGEFLLMFKWVIARFQPFGAVEVDWFLGTTLGGN